MTSDILLTHTGLQSANGVMLLSNIQHYIIVTSLYTVSLCSPVVVALDTPVVEVEVWRRR